MIQTATEPIKENDAMDIEPQRVTSDEQVTTPTSPTAVASNQLLSLMQQLEENGIQVAIGDLELELPLHSVENQIESTVSCGVKRKLNGDEGEKPTKKTSSTFRPSDIAVDTSTTSGATPSSLANLDSIDRSNSPTHSPTPIVLATPQPTNTSSPSPPPIQILDTYSIPASGSSCWRGKQRTGIHSPNQIDLLHEPPVSDDFRNFNIQLSPLFCLSGGDMKADTLTGMSEETSTPNVCKKLESTKQLEHGGPGLCTDSNKSLKACRPDGLDLKGMPSDLPPAVAEKINEAQPNVLNLESNSRSSDPSRTARQTHNERMFVLERHKTRIKCIFINGPCIFSSSEDGTVHVYDIKTGHLSMRILGHQQPVTWMFAISLNLTSTLLRNIPTTAEYLNQLDLITGSEDSCIRQFSLETGGLLHEIDCKCPLTTVAGNKTLGKLYIGSKEGSIFTYNPMDQLLKTSCIKVILPLH